MRTEEREAIATRVNGMRKQGMNWNAVAAATGLSQESARAIWRRVYGDKAGHKADPKHEEEEVVVPEEVLDEEDPTWSRDNYHEARKFDVDEWIEFLQRAQVMHDGADPVNTQASRIIKTEKPIAIQFTSCWHLGSRFVEYEGFKGYLKKLKATDRFYWGILGDEYDNFPVTFRSAEAIWSQLIPPKFQRLLVRAIVEDLVESDKVIYACWSNHPGHDEKFDGENRMKTIYQQAHVPYFDGKGVLKLTVGKQTYIIYSAHMFAGTSQWNRNHPQVRALTFDLPSADVVVQGHRHGAGVQKVYHHPMEYDLGQRRSEYTWLVETGAAKDGKDYYAIRKWGKGLFEWPTLLFYPDVHQIKLVDDLADLEHFLA